MNEQRTTQPNENNQSSGHIRVIIVTMIVTAIIVGSGIYAWQISNLRSAEQSFEQQVSYPQNPTENSQEQTQIIDTAQKPQQQPNETTEIIKKISMWCKEYKKPECLPIKSYSVVDFDEKYSVVKISGFNYLLTKKSNEWSVSIVSEENNICETGSDNPDLVEYCRR